MFLIGIDMKLKPITLSGCIILMVISGILLGLNLRSDTFVESFPIITSTGDIEMRNYKWTEVGFPLRFGTHNWPLPLFINLIINGFLLLLVRLLVARNR